MAWRNFASLAPVAVWISPLRGILRGHEHDSRAIGARRQRHYLCTTRGFVRRVAMRVTTIAAPIAAAALMLCAIPTTASAHCDSLDGPVVKAAQQALASRDVRAVLIWVGAGDEAEIRSAFDQTLAVRELDPRARALADRYFFETVVRVHRAGEGAPY